MSKASDLAYAEAQRLIAEAKATGATQLDLDSDKTRALIDLPPEIAGLTALTTLYLSNTQVADIAPLTGLTALTTLFLDDTQVADIAPLAGLTALTTLDLRRTRAIDLRPLSKVLSLLTPDPERPKRFGPQASGLSFSDTPACADPRIAEIAAIEDPALRARTLFDYLQDWVPPTEVPMPNQLEQDELLPVLLVNGRLEIYANTPSEEERQNQANQILHQRLLSKAKALADAAGNQFPDLANRARTVFQQLDRDFAGVNLFALHLELEDLEDRRKTGSEDDQPYSDKVKLALSDVTRLGPGLTVGHPQVELLLDRRRKAREDPMPAVESAAHGNLSASVITDSHANGPNIRLTEAEVQIIADRAAAQAIQRSLHRNYLRKIALVVIANSTSFSLGLAGNVIADHFKPEIWHFLAANWTIINEVALSYGSTFANWFTHATEPITQTLSTMATIEPHPVNRKR